MSGHEPRGAARPIPGRYALRRAHLKELRAAPEDDPRLIAIADDIAAGGKMSDVADRAGVSLSALKALTKSRADVFDPALIASAEAHVEAAGAILDDAASNVDLNTAQASIARDRSGYRRWVAARRDPAWSDKLQVDANVSVDFGDSFIAVLGRRMERLKPPAAAPVDDDLVVIEAELVDDDAPAE